ncbi:MAG: pyruvate ferredoxin oxidoreductase [Candidatus Nanoarchaeia archaeon]|nr:pyruvate ferredoxin oxidoreductase [Candidatus Nanoarchaeia archaeon]
MSGKKVALTGAHAAAEAMKQINPDVVPVYPITPQTPIIEKFCYFKAEGQVDAEVVLAESEHSVMSISVGASAAGARVMTASASQGISLMNEVLSVASGMRLPIIMTVVNRSISSPLNIHCDQCSTMNVRDLGWIQLFAENPQEAYDFTIIATKLAEAINMPVMVCQDGFITSHCVEMLEIIDDKKVKGFVGKYNPKEHLLDTSRPLTFGAWQLPNTYMETKIEQQEAINRALKEYPKVAKAFAKITGRNYAFVEKYKTNDADAIMVATCSTAGTVKAVIDRMRKKKKKVGLLKIYMLRPFPKTEIAKALEKANAVCVLDRAINFGAEAPLYTEIKNALFESKKKPRVESRVFGLGGRDIFEEQIEAVFNSILSNQNKEKKGGNVYIK